jgi:ferredoxin-NADP reductase
MLVKLDHSEPVADHIQSFYFQPERPIKHTAGQFIELTITHPNPDSRGQKHWFTVSASPTEDMPAITTKFPAEGQTSTYKQALQALKPGDEVMMSDPMGDFVLPKDKSIPLVFIAGGIGVTPFRSMIKYLLDTGEKRDITLLYAANTLPEVAFRDLFAEYGLEAKIFLSKPDTAWKGETGQLTAQRILEMAPDKPGQLYFASGPEPMVEALVKGLQDAGVDKRRLVGDYFPNYPDNVTK